jgi:acyl-CoA thioesterase FadM
MNLYFRLLHLILSHYFKKAPRKLLTEQSVLHFKVWPFDLDINAHMNNARYFALMDLGRMDLMLQCHMAKTLINKKWLPVLGASTIRYRIPLLPFQKFTLTTDVKHWDDSWFYMEQRFIIQGGKKHGAVAAIALVKGSFFDGGDSKKLLPTARVFEAAKDQTSISPELDEYMKSWIKAESDLQKVTANQPK